MMKTKEEVRSFLNSLQWERMTKNDLQKKLQSFFDTTNELADGTDNDNKELDYSFLFTTADEDEPFFNFIDIEIYYLKMRQRNSILITSTELLEYVE